MRDNRDNSIKAITRICFDVGQYLWSGRNVIKTWIINTFKETNLILTGYNLF